MLRTCLVILVLAATTSSGGCRSCSTCHDYGPPVANCGCSCCGTQRAGSASEYADTPFEDDGTYDSHNGYYESNGELPQPQPIEMP